MLLRLLEVARDRAGTAMIEFAFVLPLLTIVLLGVLQFGIFFYDYVSVEYAAQLGERTFLANRPFPGESFTPYTSTVTAIQDATSLPSGDLTITTSVCTATPCTSSASFTPCTTDTSCGTALTNAYSGTTQGAASVTVSYPCLTLLPVSWTPWIGSQNFCPGGILTSTITQRVD